MILYFWFHGQFEDLKVKMYVSYVFQVLHFSCFSIAFTAEVWKTGSWHFHQNDPFSAEAVSMSNRHCIIISFCNSFHTLLTEKSLMMNVNVVAYDLKIYFYGPTYIPLEM